MRRQETKKHCCSHSAHGSATDPVCGMQVDTAQTQHHAEIDGIAYHFCSDRLGRRGSRGDLDLLRSRHEGGAPFYGAQVRASTARSPADRQPGQRPLFTGASLEEQQCSSWARSRVSGRAFQPFL